MKKEKQLRLLESQFHEYAAASNELDDQAGDLDGVKDALYSKMEYLNNMIKPLEESEKTNMRLSLGSDSQGQVKAPDATAAAAPVAAAPAAAAAAPAAAPAEAAAAPAEAAPASAF